MYKQKITKLLEEALTIRKLAVYFSFFSLFWLVYATRSLSINFQNELFGKGLLLYIVISSLLFHLLRRIIRARREMRVSILELYFYLLFLVLHNFIMIYLYHCQIFTSWKSLLICIPISVGLSIYFIMRITGKYAQK